MNFAPRAVFLYGPVPTGNVYVAPMNNQSYIGYAYIDIEPQTAVPAAVNCAGSDPWPNIFFGNNRGQARLYESSNGLDGYTTPLLAENRLVTSNLSLWSMNGDQVAGCEPISTMAYTPTYTQYFNSYPAFCAVESNDYRLIRENWHPSVHKSYLDFYRLHDGAEASFVSAQRSFTYDPMDIPAMWTRFIDIVDHYTFTIRSQHVLNVGERAKYIAEVSSSPTFEAGTVDTLEGTMSLVQHWVTGPPYTGWVYDYHEASITWFLNASPTTQYLRFKRHDELIAYPNVYSDSEWSSTVTITNRERTDELVLNGSPAWTPYYCYQDYDATDTHHYWAVYIHSKQNYHDQNTDLARIQISATEDFATVLYDNTVSYVYDVDGYSYAGVNRANWYGWGYGYLNYGTVYYARTRNENADGSVVSEWSNVFELDGGNDGANHVDRCNHFLVSGATYVAETHYTGDMTEWEIASEPLYKSGHTYVLLCKRRTNYVGIVRTWWGSLYLADYDGTSVTTTLIEGEVADWYPIGWPDHYDIVEFGGKIYAGWDSPSDPVTNLYDWCEITGGVVGTVYHVARPAEAPIYCNWATMAVIHGDLRVVASLDTDDNSGVGNFAFIMGIANILSDIPAMKVYSSIKTGYYFIKDPWLGSLWFDYANYAATESAICWLGEQSNAIWYMGI